VISQRNLVLGLTLLGLVSLVGCAGGSTAVPTSAPVAVPTATPAPTATPIPATTATPAPTVTPEPAGEKVSFNFVTQLSTAEEGDDIQRALHDVEGILSIRGDEFGLTITYDPKIITPEELRQKLAQIGHPVQP
jgi:hypothetical protein